MKRPFLQAVLATAVTAFSITVPTLASAGDADFTLVNRTGYDISEVYISPANKNNWGRDRLGKNVLENGRSKLFTFSDSANCLQDLKVVFDDDNSSVVWEDFDLCKLHKITIRYNRKTDTVSAESE